MKKINFLLIGLFCTAVGLFDNCQGYNEITDLNDLVTREEIINMLSSVASRPVQPQIIPVYIDCFDDSNEWGDLYGLVLSDVTEYEGEKAYLCGNKNFSSILVTHEPDSTDYNYGRMHKDFTKPKDFSGCHFAFRVKVIEGQGADSWQNIQQLSLGFIDVNGKTALFRSTRYWGWQETRKTQTDFHEGDSTIDWSHIKQIEISFFAKKDSAPKIILDRLVMFRCLRTSDALFDNPIVINTFDDGCLSQYDAAAYLSGKCMFGTFYVIGNRVEYGFSEKLTLTQLKDMQWAGHLIANHTWSHPMPFSDLSLTEQVEEIINMQRWLFMNGFGKGARLCCTPGGYLDPQLDEALSPYVDQIREVTGGYGSCRNPIIEPTRMRMSANTPLGMIDQIEKALAADEPPSIVVYVGHEMTDNMEDFISYIDYLESKRNSGKIDVCTSADILAGHR